MSSSVEVGSSMTTDLDWALTPTDPNSNCVLNTTFSYIVPESDRRSRRNSVPSCSGQIELSAVFMSTMIRPPALIDILSSSSPFRPDTQGVPAHTTPAVIASTTTSTIRFIETLLFRFSALLGILTFVDTASLAPSPRERSTKPPTFPSPTFFPLSSAISAPLRETPLAD